MKDTNRELLDEVIKDRLTRALNNGGDAEEKKATFDEAMMALDRQVKLDEIEASREEQIRNEEVKKDEAKKDRIVRCVEIGVLLLAAPMVETVCKKAYAKMLCEFEKDYTFTTTAGRALSGLFRFKK